MVEGIGHVVKLPVLARGIVRIIERAAQPTGDVETSGDADVADGIQPVRILKNARLCRPGRDSGRKAVSLYGVAGLVNPFL